jgi:hypothetical protein
MNSKTEVAMNEVEVKLTVSSAQMCLDNFRCEGTNQTDVHIIGEQTKFANLLLH